MNKNKTFLGLLEGRGIDRGRNTNQKCVIVVVRRSVVMVPYFQTATVIIYIPISLIVLNRYIIIIHNDTYNDY